MSPSDTLVTVPVTVRIVALETGMFINAVSPAIKNKRKKVLKRNIFECIVYIKYGESSDV